MTDLKEWHKALINATIMAGISLIGMLLANLGEYNIRILLAAALTGGMTFLTLLGRYFQPPETDVNDKKPEAAKTVCESGTTLKSAIGCLWVV